MTSNQSSRRTLLGRLLAGLLGCFCARQAQTAAPNTPCQPTDPCTPTPHVLVTDPYDNSQHVIFTEPPTWKIINPDTGSVTYLPPADKEGYVYAVSIEHPDGSHSFCCTPGAEASFKNSPREPTPAAPSQRQNSGV